MATLAGFEPSDFLRDREAGTARLPYRARDYPSAHIIPTFRGYGRRHSEDQARMRSQGHRELPGRRLRACNGTADRIRTC